MARRLVLVALVAGLSSGLGACSSSDDAPPPGDDGSLAAKGGAQLLLHVRDVWGRPLERGRTVRATQGGRPIEVRGDADSLRLSIPLGPPTRVVVTAEDHEDAEIDLSLDGSRELVVASPKGGRVGLAARRGRGEQEVWVGARHRWFSSQGRAARPGNKLTLLMDGEEAWTAVHAELTKARRQILASTWWWESSFELVRPPAVHTSLTPDQRRANTVMGLLEASPATKRVLVNQFWRQDGLASGFTVDDALVEKGKKLGDNFEFMGQANATSGRFSFAIAPVSFVDRLRAVDPALKDAELPFENKIASDAPTTDVDLTQWPVSVDVQHASWHQKFMVVDEVAFVGGMNLRRVDWDTSQHLVFEPRRMLFDATRADREAVAAKDKQPDMGPRKDYMMRVEGPIAADVADVFRRRWERARADKVEHSSNTTELTAEVSAAEVAGGVTAQVTATMPAPFSENAILETWHNAIRQAREYIFIEDQYFRMPILNDAIETRLREVPDLRLIVVTKPINEWTDPGCFWTYKSAERFRKAFPSRFLLLQLRAFATGKSFGIDEVAGVFADMDVHSKMLMVDDRFLSVGSANKNNRGVLYEGELNVAVLDKDFVTTARRRILSNMLGETAPDGAVTLFERLADRAKANDAVYTAWKDEGGDLNLNGAPLPAKFQPRGFVYSLVTPAPTECLMESVGPDMTGVPDRGRPLPE